MEAFYLVICLEVINYLTRDWEAQKRLKGPSHLWPLSSEGVAVSVYQGSNGH